MIVIKVELWSGGSEENAEEIGRTYITNDGTGSISRGNYDVEVCRRGTKEKPSQGGRGTREGRVENFPRKSYSIWRLVVRALLQCFPEEK